MTAKPQSSFVQEPPSPAELKEIADILYEHAGIVLAPGKTSMVQSRLQKRLRALGLSSYQAYIQLVRSEDGKAERREMVSALTTNVTHYFREEHHFKSLRERALPDLLTKARSGKKIRIWSAGCSNGQEAYSIALTLADVCPNFSEFDIRILATDIDPVMIRRGQHGTYEESALAPIPEHMRKKYFSQQPDGWQIAEPLRKLVSFRELNIHSSWPMKGMFSIIFCRNMMIYFDADDQAKIWKRFEEKLEPGGWLFVGHSERVPLDTGSRLKPDGITTYHLPEAGSNEGGSKWP